MKKYWKHSVAILLIITLLFSIVGVNIHYQFCSTNNKLYLSWNEHSTCEDNTTTPNCDITVQQAVSENDDCCCCDMQTEVDSAEETCANPSATEANGLFNANNFKAQDCCKQYEGHVSIDLSLVVNEKTVKIFSQPDVAVKENLLDKVVDTGLFKTYQKNIYNKLILPIKKLIRFIHLAASRDKSAYTA